MLNLLPDLLLSLPASGVYLSLIGNFVPNHGYVALEDIGSSDSTALLCHTNRPNINLIQPSNPHSGGNWFSPSNIRVDGKNTPGFRRNRDVMVVRLKQTAVTGPANEGIYCCLAEDRDGVNKTKCAGIYSNSGGIMITTIFLVVYQVTV